MTDTLLYYSRLKITAGRLRTFWTRNLTYCILATILRYNVRYSAAMLR